MTSLPSHKHTPVEFEAKGLACIRDDRVLFEDLCFKVQAGEALVLEGRNGSGKTSLLRILCGIRLPESGDLLWNSQDIFKLGPEFREHIAYLGHKDGHKPDLTPMENLRIAQGLGKAKDDITLEAALEQVGLFGFEDVPTRNMSAGQQRRLAIARLLVTDAKLWILDEPFTSLDRSAIEHMERLFEAHLERGGMAAMTTHHRVGFRDDVKLIRINLSER